MIGRWLIKVHGNLIGHLLMSADAAKLSFSPYLNMRESDVDVENHIILRAFSRTPLDLG